MSICVVRAAMNRVAKRHTRLDEVEMKPEPPPKALSDHFEMQFALRGNDRLMQLRIDTENKCRIFVVQRREPRGHFVLFTWRLGSQRADNVRARTFRHARFQRIIRRADCGPGVRGREYPRRADVSRAGTE